MPVIKTVMTAGYAHRSNTGELVEKKVPEDMRELFWKFLSSVEAEGIQYDIIKYDKGNITLITSPDWNTANEPIVGFCMRWNAGNWFNSDGTLNKDYKKTANFRQVYHNKWQFVEDGYTGFDVEKSKKRTAEWNSIPNINKSKIGYKKYWEKLLSENGLKI